MVAAAELDEDEVFLPADCAVGSVLSAHEGQRDPKLSRLDGWFSELAVMVLGGTRVDMGFPS